MKEFIVIPIDPSCFMEDGKFVYMSTFFANSTRAANLNVSLETIEGAIRHLGIKEKGEDANEKVQVYIQGLTDMVTDSEGAVALPVYFPRQKYFCLGRMVPNRSTEHIDTNAQEPKHTVLGGLPNNTQSSQTWLNLHSAVLHAACCQDSTTERKVVYDPDSVAVHVGESILFNEGDNVTSYMYRLKKVYRKK